MIAWILWVLASAFGIWVFWELIVAAEGAWRAIRHPVLERETRQAAQRLLRLQECLEAGVVPDRNEWSQFETLGAPWGNVAGRAVQDLRARGASVLPTLRRLRALADEMLEFNAESRTKSGGALAQAVTLACLVPALALALWALVEEIQSIGLAWWVAVTFACVGAGAGAAWIVRLAERAQWLGLKRQDRDLVLASQVLAERLLALIRCGHAPDVAWTETLAGADVFADRLGALWGHGFWNDKIARTENVTGQGLRQIADLGLALRRAIQVAVMDGHPATERIESLLAGFRRDFRGAVGRELAALPNRALKPLFVCVMPSVAVLLVAGFGLALLGL